MNKKKYLDRIGYTGKTEPTLKVLGELQKAHLLQVPFENLDIHYGIPIELDMEKIYQKIVLRRRGGFCYELNGLFYELLTAIGFEVKRISAMVFDTKSGYGEEYDHLALLVRIGGKEYLTDVGFGEFAMGPLSMETESIQHDQRGDFVVERQPNDSYLVSKLINNERKPEYLFTPEHRHLSEYQDRCRYHQTDPRSTFTRKRLISRPTEQGRITISGDLLKITRENSIEEIALPNEGLFRTYLKKYFELSPDRLKFGGV